jgi:hypothetical protein
MRIEKGQKSSIINNVVQKTKERVFLKQQPDVFIKTNASAIKKGIIATVAASVSAGIASFTKNKIVENRDNKNYETIQQLREFDFSEEDIKKLINSSSETFDINNEKDNTLGALIAIKTGEPEFADYMLNHINEIQYCYFDEPSEKNGYLNDFNVKVGDRQLRFLANNDGKVFMKVLSDIDKDGNKVSLRDDIIVGTDEYITSKTITFKDGTQHIKKESKVIVDDLGILHKVSEEKFLDKNKNILKAVQYDIDGSITYTNYKYGNSEDNKKLKEIIKKKYNQNGSIEQETKTSISEDYSDVDKFGIAIKTDVKNIENTDYKNHTKTFAITKGKWDKLIKEERIIKNPKNGKITKEIIEKSDIDGIYNSKIIGEDGKEKIESIGIKNSDGSISIEKHFESLDGTKTDYTFKAVPVKNKDNIHILDDKGNMLLTDDFSIPNKTYKILDKDEKVITNGFVEDNTNYIFSYDEPLKLSGNDEVEMTYKITDSKGKVLTTVDRKYKRISEDTVFSSLNGHGYNIKKLDDCLSIRDLQTGEVKDIPYDKILGHSYDINAALAFVQQMPADMIFSLVNNETKLNLIDDKITSAHAAGLFINSGDDLYIFSHEQGHDKDLKPTEKFTKEEDLNNKTVLETISQNPIFRKTFESEKAAFINQLSDVQQDYMYYFLEELNHPSQRIKGSQQEIIAEANALLSTGKPMSELGARSHYLQKYFPKSIAVASTFLNPNSNIAS